MHSAYPDVLSQTVPGEMWTRLVWRCTVPLLSFWAVSITVVHAAVRGSASASC